MIPFKLNIPNSIINYTHAYNVTYKSIGLLYCFNVRVKNSKRDLSFRITSKSKNFSELYSVDLLNKHHNAFIGIRTKDQKDDSSKLVASRIIYSVLTGDPKYPLKESTSSVFEKFVQGVMQWAPFIMTLIGLLMLAYYYVLKMINWGKETLADSVYENQVNKKLFEGQNGKEPEFKIYNNLIKCIDMVCNDKKIKSVLVCGIPGTSKTHIVRRTLYFNNKKSGNDYSILKGSTMSMIDFVDALYQNRNKILILDDFDSPLNDSDVVNILKSATDSYERRIISFPRAKMISAQADGAADFNIPNKFEFQGKLIIITNKKFNDIDKALVSRCLTIEVNFTPEEFVENIRTMLKYIMPDVDMNLKLEVFSHIEQLVRKNKITGLNFRTFQNCISIRLLYPENWKNMVEYVLK